MKEQKIKSIAEHIHTHGQTKAYGATQSPFFSIRECIRAHTQTIMPPNRPRESYAIAA